MIKTLSGSPSPYSVSYACTSNGWDIQLKRGTKSLAQTHGSEGNDASKYESEVHLMSQVVNRFAANLEKVETLQIKVAELEAQVAEYAQEKLDALNGITSVEEARESYGLTEIAPEEVKNTAVFQNTATVFYSSDEPT